MKYVIEGHYFKDQAEKALLLNRCGIYPIIKNEKLVCTSKEDYINSIKILKKYEKLHCKSLRRQAMEMSNKKRQNTNDSSNNKSEFIIKGTYFLDQAEKALLLNRCGIYPIIKNQKLVCTSKEDYINSIKILKKYEKLHCKSLRRQIMKLKNKTDQNENHNYSYSHDKKEATITCNEKELKIVKKETSLNAHFYIIANDSLLDNEKTDKREITFNIKEDSPIYNIVGNIYKRNKQENTYLYKKDENNNYIKITKSENTYNFTIIKNKNDKLSNSKYALIDIGTITPDNNWFDINKMYSNIMFYKNDKKLVKSNRPIR